MKYSAKVVNAFDIFITITAKLNSPQGEKGDAISILKDSFPEITQHKNTANHWRWNKDNAVPETNTIMMLFWNNK